MSVAEIAGQIGLSHSPCWRRLRRMEEAGIIRGKAFIIDSAALGYQINVFAHIKLDRHDEKTLEDFENSVREHVEIVECFSMSGESDYSLRVISHNIEDYEIFLKKTLLHLPGVRSVNSSFALKTIKLSNSVPI